MYLREKFLIAREDVYEEYYITSNKNKLERTVALHLIKTDITQHNLVINMEGISTTVRELFNTREQITRQMHYPPLLFNIFGLTAMKLIIAMKLVIKLVVGLFFSMTTPRNFNF